MPLSKLFGGSKRKPRAQSAAESSPDEPTIEDLIVLERYDEAQARLVSRLRQEPKDLHAHLRLAEVYGQLKKGGQAVDEYVFVADEYARDGFYDKALALLAKAAKLAPLDDQLQLKMAGFRQAKVLEHKRSAAVEGLKQRQAGGDPYSAVELLAHWKKLTRSPIVDRLSADQIQRLFTHVQVRRLPAETEIAREGQKGDAVCVVAFGTIEARAAIPGRASAAVLSFGPGDVLGERVLFERAAWPAGYVAAEPSVVYLLDRPAIEGILAGNPDPRGFLEALRFQAKDREVESAVHKLRTRR